MSRNWKLVIPPGSREVIRAKHSAGGAKQRADYYVGKRLVGRREWNSAGTLVMEHGIRNGKTYGLARYWHDNGQLSQEAPYANGKEQGVARQYDDRGKLVGTYRMNHGTGLDLWYCDTAPQRGQLSEERYYKDGMLDGFERWWLDTKRVWEESHFRKNQKHGIFRQWTVSGALRRGYPQYFIADQRVTKRNYQQACRVDPTLPKFVDAENRPDRKPPKLPTIVSRRAVR